MKMRRMSRFNPTRRPLLIGAPVRRRQKQRDGGRVKQQGHDQDEAPHCPPSSRSHSRQRRAPRGASHVPAAGLRQLPSWATGIVFSERKRCPVEPRAEAVSDLALPLNRVVRG